MRESPVALVTGAARRLGAEIARGLADDGYRVAVHFAHSEQAAEELVSELPTEAALFQADLVDPAAAAELPERAHAQLGRLDVLVNSAAVLERQEFGAIEPAEWDRVIALNLRAPFLVAQGAAGHLRQAGGCIINLSDLGGREPWRDYLPHCVSKAGVDMLTRCLARELAPEVRVNAIAPGPVLPPDDWDQDRKDRMMASTPLHRLGDPRDVVRAIRYLIDSDFVTGTTLIVDGGRLIRGETEY